MPKVARKNVTVKIAVNLKPPSCDLPPDEDPSKAVFRCCWVNEQRKQVYDRCTAEVYHRIEGRFVPRKGLTGLKDVLMPTVFRLIFDAQGTIVDIDVIPEQEVLHGMQRQDLIGVDSIRIELAPEGSMKVIQRPQFITLAHLKALLRELDPLAEVPVGHMCGNFRCLSSDDRYLVFEAPYPED